MRKVFAAASLALLTACVTPERPPEQRIGSEGYVVVRLVTNAYTVTALMGRFNRLNVQADPGGQVSPLQPITGDVPGAQVFGGWVAPGTHVVASLETLAQGIAAFAGFQASPLSSFTVEAGRVTDLGTLVYQPVGDNKATLVPVAGGADLRRFAERALPNVAPRLFAEPPRRETLTPVFPIQLAKADAAFTNAGLLGLGISKMEENSKRTLLQPRWQEVTTAGDLIAAAKASTVMLHGPRHLQTGETAFGSQLGQLLVRSPDASWRNVDIGSTGETLSLTESPAGLVCGTDLGELLVGDLSGAWHPLALGQPLDPIVLVTWAGGERYVVATREPDAQVAVYELEGLQSPKLALLEHVKLATNNFSAPQPGTGGNYLARAGHSLIVAKDDQNLRVYDLDKRTWSDARAPGSFFRLKGDALEQILLLVDVYGLSRDHYLSTDGGATWNKVSAPHMVVDLDFAQPARGYGLVLKVGAFASSTAIISTSDGGKHWAEGPELKIPCQSLAVDPALPRAFCSTQSGELYSTGSGDDWKNERHF